MKKTNPRRSSPRSKAHGAVARARAGTNGRHRDNGSRHAESKKPARAVRVPHVEPIAEGGETPVESCPLARAVGAGLAVETLLKILAKLPPGGNLRQIQERTVRRPHADGLDDYTERKWGGKQRGVHLVIRDWESNYRGHVSNGTNVDIRAWGLPEAGVVWYWEREQWAIGEAPFRRAGMSIEGGNKRIVESLMRAFGHESSVPTP